MSAIEAEAPVAVSLNGLSEEELEEKAIELQREAEQHRMLSHALFAEAAKCRTRAERERQREQEEADRRKPGRKPKPKVALPYDPRDSLIAAAAVATEDLAPGFNAGDLADLLAIGRARAQKLLLALEAKKLVARLHDATKWRSIDPNEARVRDGARELGRFTVEELGEHLGMTPMELTFYIEWMQSENMIVGGGPMYEFRKLDPELVITTNGDRVKPPEKDPPSGTEILSPRGLPVRIVDHGKSAQATTRHREKLRNARHEEMQTARAARSERDRAKSAANRGSSKSKGRRKRK